MEIEKLLDEAKTALQIESNYALAKALDVPEQRISDYYKGKPLRDSYTIWKLAGVLGQDVAELTAKIMIASEKNPKKLEFWRDFLGRKLSIGKAKDLVLALFISLCVLASSGLGSHEEMQPGRA